MSAERKVSATARIQVLVEVLAGSWGDDCKFDQVYTQAGREAVAKVERLLGHEGRVIGAPKVVAVLVERET